MSLHEGYTCNIKSLILHPSIDKKWVLHLEAIIAFHLRDLRTSKKTSGQEKEEDIGSINPLLILQEVKMNNSITSVKNLGPKFETGYFHVWLFCV